jgi:hypothetical protein
MSPGSWKVETSSIWAQLMSAVTEGRVDCSQNYHESVPYSSSNFGSSKPSTHPSPTSQLNYVPDFPEHLSFPLEGPQTYKLGGKGDRQNEISVWAQFSSDWCFFILPTILTSGSYWPKVTWLNKNKSHLACVSSVLFWPDTLDLVLTFLFSFRPHTITVLKSYQDVTW